MDLPVWPLRSWSNKCTQNEIQSLNKYNAGKRCQALANAVKHSQTLGNVRKSFPNLCWKLSQINTTKRLHVINKTNFYRVVSQFILKFKIIKYI